MITATVLFETRHIELLPDLMAAYPELVTERLQDRFARDITPHLLSELRFTPGGVKYPIQWTSEKQRRAFFATNGFGKGIPYQRTGKTAEGWNVVLTIADGELVMSVENKSRSAIFVTGRRQQKFHANTGWQKHSPTVKFWQDAAREITRDEARRILRGQ